MEEYSKEWSDRYKALLKTGEIYPRRWYSYHDMMLDTVIAAACRPDAASIDVGCHAGRFTGLMSQLSQRVYAVDPNLEKYVAGTNRRIGKRWWLSRRPERIVFLNTAVADRRGTADYYESVSEDGNQKSGWNSLLGERENAARLGIHRKKIGSIPVERLDDLIHRDIPVGFIKIDVEGLERSVINGARRILNTHRPVVVYESRWATQLMNKLGYLMWPLGHVLKSPVLDGRNCMLNMLAIPEERAEDMSKTMIPAINELVNLITGQLDQGYYDREEIERWHGKHLLDMASNKMLSDTNLPNVTPGNQALE